MGGWWYNLKALEKCLLKKYGGGGGGSFLTGQGCWPIFRIFTLDFTQVLVTFLRAQKLIRLPRVHTCAYGYRFSYSTLFSAPKCEVCLIVTILVFSILLP